MLCASCVYVLIHCSRCLWPRSRGVVTWCVVSSGTVLMTNTGLLNRTARGGVVRVSRPVKVSESRQEIHCI